jgi:hypothetical protein
MIRMSLLSLLRGKPFKGASLLIALVGSAAGVLAYVNDIGIWPANSSPPPAVAAPPQTPAPVTTQTTQGPNSPIISGPQGTVIMNYGKQ